MPVASARPPSAVECVPVDLLLAPIAILSSCGPVRGGLAVAPKPIAIMLRPVAVALLPTAMLFSPEAVAPAPFATAPIPVAVARKPVAVLLSADAVEACPMAVAPRPAALEAWPTAVLAGPLAIARLPTAVAMSAATEFDPHSVPPTPLSLHWGVGSAQAGDEPKVIAESSSADFAANRLSRDILNPLLSRPDAELLERISSNSKCTRFMEPE